MKSSAAGVGQVANAADKRAFGPACIRHSTAADAAVTKRENWKSALAPGQVESAHACDDNCKNNPMGDLRAFGLDFFRVMEFSQATHDSLLWMNPPDGGMFSIASPDA